MAVKTYPKKKTSIAPKEQRRRIKLRNIGNSKGILFSKKMLEEVGLDRSAEVQLQVIDGNIIISGYKSRRPLNLDTSTWESEIKKEMKNDKPESDLFAGMVNAFDKKEWTW